MPLTIFFFVADKKKVLADSLAISFGNAIQFPFPPPVVPFPPASLSFCQGSSAPLPHAPPFALPTFISLHSESVQSIGMLFLPLPLVRLLAFPLLPSHSASVPPNPFDQSCVHPLRVDESHPPLYWTKLSSKYFSNGTKARFTMHLPSSGFVVSDGYPNGYENQKCSLELVAPPSSGLVVHLSFDDLDLEAPYSRSEQCLRDYIVITIIDHDGREHTSDRICGGERPKPMRTMQSRARILFIASSLSSNGERTQKWKGFRMKFEFVPESTILAPSSFYYDTDRRHLKECGGANSPTEMSGEIHSPGFPFTYPRNVTCNWLLRVAPDHRIHIRLSEFELSSAFECEKASLQFFDGFRHDFEFDASSDGAFPLRHSQQPTTTDALFCGGSAYYGQEGMKSFLSERNRVFVRFTTREGPTQKQLADYEAKRRPIGFRLIWTEVESLVQTSADDPRAVRNSLSGVTNQSLVGAEQCAGFVCSGGEFCVDATENICVERMRLCINETLRCDGMANCAENDDSDEAFCYVQKLMSLATIVPLMLLLSLLLVLFCFFYCILKCLRIRANRNEQKCGKERTKTNNGKGKKEVEERRGGRRREVGGGQKGRGDYRRKEETAGRGGRGANCGSVHVDNGAAKRSGRGRTTDIANSFIRHTPKNGNAKFVTDQWGGHSPCICPNEASESEVWAKRTPIDEMWHGNGMVYE